jgi:hypothetical protein
MEVLGKIKLQTPTQTFGNDFTKCELVVTTNEQYPQVLAIEFVKDKIELLNAFKVGDDVKVSINLRGREWVNPQGETKYFNSIQGWRIEASDVSAEGMAQPQAAPSLSPNDKDDLPF